MGLWCGYIIINENPILVRRGKRSISNNLGMIIDLRAEGLNVGPLSASGKGRGGGGLNPF
jgi:hypothetical protein